MTIKPKRKSTYRPEWEREFKGICNGKDEFHVHCIPCNDEIDITSMGKTAISIHQKKPKHRDAVKASASTKALFNFLPNLSKPSPIDEKVIAAEGAWAFHVAIHHHSFKSTNCVSMEGFFKTIFPDSQIAKKFSSARSKTAAIITGALAPYSVKKLLEELGSQPYSVSIDASNHNELKLFPLIIRFFNTKSGVQVRLLDLRSLPGEDSQLVYEFIVSVLEEYHLDFALLIAFCADNAPVNFGGAMKTGQNNIFKFLKKISKSLIPIGCPAHILHNSAQKGADRLLIDVEAIVFKLTSFFKGSTLRHEKLKEFCEFVEIEYATIPTHGTTRWTTLLKVIDRILELWDALSSLFGSIDKPPKLLEDFFQSDEAKVVCYFLQSVLKVFQKSINALQKVTLLLPELVDIMTKFRFQMTDRKKREFYGAATTTAMNRMDDPRKMDLLKTNFQEFYDTIIAYVDQWFRLEKLPTHITWIMLSNSNVDYEEVKLLAEQIAPEIAAEDELFDEVSQFNQILEQIPSKIFDNETSEKKWMKIFKENESLPRLYKLVSSILSIPVSNSFVESVFSMIGAQWTKERNSLTVNTIKSLAQVLVNFDVDCSEMYQLILKDHELLKKVSSWEKYQSD